MSFKIGDRVVIINHFQKDIVGAVTTIVGGRGFIPNFDGPFPFQPGYPLFRLDIPGRIKGVQTGAPGEWLELYRDDGNEKAEWTEELKNLCKIKEHQNA